MNRGIQVFKIRCNGESYGWTETLLHPGIYHTALETQISLDRETETARGLGINLLAVGIGLETKEKLIERLTKYTNDKGDICINALGYVLINSWKDYWDIV